MNIEVLVTSALSNAAAIAIAAIIIKTWLKTAIKTKIEHSYNAKLEEIKTINTMEVEALKKTLSEAQAKQIEIFKRELLIKDKSAKIAELFAEWYSHPENQKDLNRLTLEAFLWLPDDVCQRLSDVLAHQNNAPDARRVLLDVRRVLLGTTSLNENQIIIFSQETRKKITEKALLEKKTDKTNI